MSRVPTWCKDLAAGLVLFGFAVYIAWAYRGA